MQCRELHALYPQPRLSIRSGVGVCIFWSGRGCEMLNDESRLSAGASLRRRCDHARASHVGRRSRLAKYWKREGTYKHDRFHMLGDGSSSAIYSQEVLGSRWGAKHVISRDLPATVSELRLLHPKTVKLTGILTWPSLPMVLCFQVNSFSLRPHHLSGCFLLQLFHSRLVFSERSRRLPR